MNSKKIIDEYEYLEIGKKYGRVEFQHYGYSCNPFWVEASNIKWLADKYNDIAIAKDILLKVACDTHDMEFANYVLNRYLSNEIIPSKTYIQESEFEYSGDISSGYQKQYRFNVKDEVSSH